MLGIYIDNMRLPWMPSIFNLAKKTDVTLFLNNFSELDVHTDMAVLASQHIWSFPYPIIAADTFSARYLYECPVPRRRIFYVNYADWATNAFCAADTSKAASLELWCQPELESVVNKVWGKATVVRDWNYEAIQRLLGQ